MLLPDKNAVVYGGGGAIGGSVARAFAREGASVILAGRTLAELDHVASDIAAAEGKAEAAEVDAPDERAIEEHADAVADTVGGIDIALNAVGFLHAQGTPFADLSLRDYAQPITAYTRTQFLTARATSTLPADDIRGRQPEWLRWFTNGHPHPNTTQVEENLDALAHGPLNPDQHAAVGYALGRETQATAPTR
jgi:NAD(P)-dependent dehydrogenase (short-subunit alcohol dehydrogenase family)